jgi:hypothetical protein
LWRTYRLRVKRKRFLVRAFRKRRELSPIADRTATIAPRDVLVFGAFWNERIRLPYFLDYYRKLGIGHFLIVDNASTDGTREYLEAQPDVSLWRAEASYKRARYGADWLNWLLRRHGTGHWCLTVDADEFFVYPFCDTRPIRALTDWLDASSIRSLSAMLIDLYPKGRIGDVPYREGQNPFEIAAWFDPGNYSYKRNPFTGELWIQGGPRARTFFADDPERAPALNKIPLVKWDRSYVYLSSTHMLLPRGLNLVYDEFGGEKASACLLHAKMLNILTEKAEDEKFRHQHFAASQEYRAYAEKLKAEPEFWGRWSERFKSWRQLEEAGLMSKGNWA